MDVLCPLGRAERDGGRYAFTGMDRALNTTKALRDTNTIFLHLRVDASISDEFLLERLLSRLERRLDAPKSALRARFAEENGFYYYDSASPKTLARKLAKRAAQEPTY